MLKLSSPVTRTDHVLPACLPQEGYDISQTRGCMITGWGATNGLLPGKGEGEGEGSRDTRRHNIHQPPTIDK